MGDRNVKSGHGLTVPRLTRKQINLGIPLGMRVWRDRTTNKIEPVVDDLAKDSGVDTYTYCPEPLYDRFLLFTALLITNHPQIKGWLVQARGRLGLRALLKYEREYDEEGSYYLRAISGMSEALVRRVGEELDLFFGNVGKNLSPEDWRKAIKYLLLTGNLPLPQDAALPMEFIPRLDEQESAKFSNYPVIVIKKRIREHELDQFRVFLEDQEKTIVRASSWLPDEPVKRTDFSLVKLAIGLQIFREKTGSWINLKYDGNVNYFGLDKDGRGYLPGNEVLFKLKAYARDCLNKLYPL